MSEIPNSDKTGLLFKEFTGVANVKQASVFPQENFAFKDYIFGNRVFSEDIPDTLPFEYRATQLDLSTNITDGSFIDFDGTAGYPDYKLRFYKKIQLEPAEGGSLKSWFLPDGLGGSLLKNAIPFKFDASGSSYVQKCYRKLAANTYFQIQMYSLPLFWLFDYKSGFLEFYGSETTLGSFFTDTSGPCFSFFQYIGAVGAGGGGGGTDVSGIDADLSGVHLKLDEINRMILPEGCVDVSGAVPPYDLSGAEVVRTYFNYVRSNSFIGYHNLPIMDSSGCVDHSQDPSHNILGLEGTDLSGVSVFELDVSGGAYISKGIVLGPSGGIWIESVSGDTHTIGSGTTGDMEMTTSNHFAVHTQKQNALFVASGGNVGIGTAAPGAALHVMANSTALDVSGESIFRGDVEIEYNNETIASFHHNEIYGIQFYKDISMNMKQINLIGDATDSSGVPSWGQVQQAIKGVSGGSSHWDLSGSHIFNNNSGSVNITENAFVSMSATQSIISADKNLYTRNTNLIDTLKIGFETFYDKIWNLMIGANENGTYTSHSTGVTQTLSIQNPGKSNAVPTFSSAWGPCVIPIAYLDINQNYVPTPFDPKGGQIFQTAFRPDIANTTAYFTIKFSEPYDAPNSATIGVDWKVATLYKQYNGSMKSGVAAITEQTITFMVGYIDSYQLSDPSGASGDRRRPKPFIKVISTNIGNLKCLTGITVESNNIDPASIDGLTQNMKYYGFTIDTPKIGGICRIIVAESCPGLPADKETQNKAWLLLEQQWNVEPWQIQAGVNNSQIIEALVGKHIINVRMYSNNLGDLNASRNPPNTNEYNTDWQLVTEKQIQDTGIYSWEKFALPMGNYAVPQVFNPPTSPPVTDIPFTLMVGGTPCPNPITGILDFSYPTIVDGANLWEVWLNLKNWPYGITTTEEIFENNVDICGNLVISGSTFAQAITATNITCNNLDALNSIDVGPNQKLTITENNIVSTVAATGWAPNPGGTGSFNPGLEFEAENFYFDCGNGVTRGFVISLGDNTSNTIFRIVDNNNNYNAAAGTPPLFQVEGSGYTQTQHISPFIDLSYNIGAKYYSGNILKYKRYNTLYINDVEATGNVDIGGNLNVGGTTTLNDNVDISGNADIGGNVTISGTVDISGDVDICGNVDISGGLRVSLDVDICGNTTIDGILTAPTIKTFDLSGTNIDLAAGGMFRLKDNYTGAASNHVVVARADQNKVNFGGYDYTGVGSGIIGTKTGRNRVIVNLEAGATQFGLNVQDSGSVIQTLGGIKMLPLQSNANGAPPNYAAPGWGASLFLGEWGWGNQNWNNLLSKRLSQRTNGQNFPGSGNVYCNAVRQNIVYTNLNNQGPIWNAGYQGPTSNTMYYNQGDIRYIVVDPKNGSSNYAQVTLPTISAPMLGQPITITRANVPTTYTGHKTAVYVQADTPDRINCPSSIFVDGGTFGGIALDPFNDISGNSSVVLPIPYKGTEICSVTLVASQNGYYNEIPNSSGEPQGGAITNQFVWQFISSGNPGN